MTGVQTCALPICTPVTIAWNEVSNSWKTTYSFVPECYASLGDNIYSFKNGVMWIHDVNPIRNNFYGQQFTSQLQIVLNDQPDFEKVFNSCILETKQDNGGCDWQATDVYNLSGQRSRIPKGIFSKIREKFFSPFKKDLTDETKPDRKSTRLNSSHIPLSRMPSSA